MGNSADATYTIGARPAARKLRAALRANAAFSLASGALLIAAGVWLADVWGLGPVWLPPTVGVLLISFAVLVAWVAVLPTDGLRKAARLVTAADVAWVVGSAALLAVAILPIGGSVAVAATAAVVAVLAAWQWKGLRILRSRDPLADVEVFEAGRVLPAPPAAVWPVVTDHELYGRLAPNLHKVEVISEAGQPLRRRCTNNGGDGWEETCTLWEDNHRYAVEVDTSDYPYPLASLHGLWQVDPHPEGSLVTMRFVYRARLTPWGGLFAMAFRPLFPPILSRILRGWAARAAQSSPPSAAAIVMPYPLDIRK